MTLATKIWLVIALISNTVTIWLIINAGLRQSRRIDGLEQELLAIKFITMGFKRSTYDTGIQSMAEDTKVAE